MTKKSSTLKIDDPESYHTKTINWQDDTQTVIKNVVRVFLFNKDGELLLRFQGNQSGDEAFLLGPTANAMLEAGEDAKTTAEKALKETTKLKADLIPIGETIEIKPKQVTKAALFVGKNNSLPSRNEAGETFVFAGFEQVQTLYHEARLYFGFAFDEKILQKWFDLKAFKVKK